MPRCSMRKPYEKESKKIPHPETEVRVTSRERIRDVLRWDAAMRATKSCILFVVSCVRTAPNRLRLVRRVGDTFADENQ